MNQPVDPYAGARKRLLRRATLYAVGFLAAGVVIAVAGAALIAWMLRGTGQPFVRTWLIVTAIVLLPGLIAAVWKMLRDR